MGRVSMPQGKGSQMHNRREYEKYGKPTPDNIDVSKSHENITLVDRDINEAYREIFGEALDKYNAKQKRADRKIEDYCDHIKKSKNGEKLFYEDVVQWGSKDDFQNPQTRERAKEALVKYVEGFEERNPNLKLIGAYIHMDEASPHLHLDYVPVAHGYSRGLSTRNSLDRAMKEMGFAPENESRKNNATKLWKESERSYFGEICRSMGLEVEMERQSTRKNLSVEEYKDARDEMLGNIEQEKEAIVAEVEPLRELKTGIDEIAGTGKNVLPGDGAIKKKDIEVSVKRYGIDALGAMAQGLFCSLLIGTILNTLGTQLHLGFLTDTVATVSGVSYTVGGLASAMSGPAMAVAIGYALKCPPLVLFSLITVGFASNALGGAGGPLAVYFVAIIAAEAGKMISKETKVDILVTPLITIGVGTGVAALIAPALGKAAMKIGELIMLATNLQPFLMGIAVSVLVGIALTLPISSAAICAAFGLTGLAGGAAVAGCCAQMVGFAVMSFKENRWGGLVSQGIGTSMLQMGNIIKNPRIWIAPIITSAITGPLATCIFKLNMNGTAVSSGMGTCGLVGQIGVYSGWVNDVAAGTKASITAMDWAGLILISFVLPAVICPLINMFLKKLGCVKDGDMKLS